MQALLGGEQQAQLASVDREVTAQRQRLDPNDVVGQQVLKDLLSQQQGLRDSISSRSLPEVNQARDAYNAKIEEGKAAFGKLLADADALLEAGKFADAAALLHERWNAIKSTPAEFLPEGAAAGVKSRLDGLAQGASTLLTAPLKAAEEAAPEFPGAKFVSSRRSALDAMTGILPPADAKYPEAARLREIHSQAEKTLGEALAVARDAARAALSADRAEFFRTYLGGIRRWSPTGDDAFTSPFFDYQWAACEKAWKDLHGRMKTQPWKDRVAAKAAQYASFPRLFARIAEMVKSNAIKSADFPDSVSKRTTMLLDSNKRGEATADGVWVLRVSGPTRQSAFIQFREMTPVELFTDFLGKGQGLPLTAADHVDLAVFLAEAGAGDLAWGELSLSGTALPADSPLHRWIEGEATMHTNYHGPGGVMTLLAEYEHKREANARQAEIDLRRKAVEDAIHRLEAEERFYTTDYFVLHHSMQGADGVVPERMLPAALVNEVVRTLGVPGAVLPEEPPPAPAEGGSTPPSPKEEAGPKEASAPQQTGDRATENPK